MKKMWTVAALGLLLGLGVATSRGRADEPPVVIPNSNNGGYLVMPASNCDCAGQTTQPRKGPFEKMKSYFNGAPAVGVHGCYPNTDISCGTWRQEYKFLFGSCNDFFGCPCFKTPEQLMSISESEYLGRVSPGLNRVNKAYP